MVLERWLHVHNTMLEKVVGIDRIDKLRVINIFEADFNLIMGILWSQRLSRNAEKHRAFGDYQWGGRKGKNSIDPVLL